VSAARGAKPTSSALDTPAWALTASITLASGTSSGRSTFIDTCPTPSLSAIPIARTPAKPYSPPSRIKAAIARACCTVAGGLSCRLNATSGGRAVTSAANGSTQSTGTRSARERALALIETAARSGGDIAAANQAEIQRLTLERQGEGPILAALNWTAGWEIGGYLVRPWHPLVVLVVFFGFAALVRSWKARKSRRGLKVKARGFGADLWQSLTAIWRFNPGDGGVVRFGEQLITKVLVVAFVLSLGNAQPGVSPIVKGILP